MSHTTRDIMRETREKVFSIQRQVVVCRFMAPPEEGWPAEGKSSPQVMSKKRATQILARLSESIPDTSCELAHRDAWELLMATILSAQCTDERVNQVTPTLFDRWPDPEALAGAPRQEVEEVVRPTGFYRNKARAIQECSAALMERFGGQVPRTLEELVTLPGVGRKTANLILGECFGVPGVVVDTHVKRVAARLGLTTREEADEVEQDLMRLIPRPHWSDGSSRLLLHGRYVCLARKPRCEECVLSVLCPSARV